MITMFELILLREYLGLSQSDVGLTMLSTKQTISNIETCSSKNKTTRLFYEQTLLRLLKEQTGNTYEEYLERQIAMYKGFLDSHKKEKIKSLLIFERSLL